MYLKLPSKQAVEGSNPSAFTVWDKSIFFLDLPHFFLKSFDFNNLKKQINKFIGFISFNL